MRWVLVVLGVLAVAALAFIVASVGYLNSAGLRNRIAVALSTRFNADVAIDRLELNVLPTPHVNGSGITLRVRGRQDLPPFISLDRFSMDLQPLSAWRRHVNTLHVDGLKIQVPPDEARKTLRNPQGDGSNPSKVMIEKLITHDAELTFVPSKPGHRPHTFLIHGLELDRLAFERPISFRAQLVNPIPEGLVETSGTFGPWVKDEPGETSINGTYVFSNADLSTIDGISGTLSSKGSFDGRITAIAVQGTTTTPNFNLTLGGRALPLETTFAATVDGTNGTVVLRSVDARLHSSTIKASGAVVNLPGPGRHSTDLQISVPEGHIEDLLALVTPAGRNVAVGDITLRAGVHLPPGHSSTVTRLAVDGKFALTRATFKDKVQERVLEFSRRTQGKSVEEMDPSVASNVRGSFALADGSLRLRRVAFEVPGAKVALDGSCNLRTRALDLQGTLTMQASISRAVGGFKSIFLKIVDPFFRHKDGTVLPIKIGGTMDAPSPALNFRSKNKKARADKTKTQK